MFNCTKGDNPRYWIFPVFLNTRNLRGRTEMKLWNASHCNGDVCMFFFLLQSWNVSSICSVQFPCIYFSFTVFTVDYLPLYSWTWIDVVLIKTHPRYYIVRHVHLQQVFFMAVVNFMFLRWILNKKIIYHNFVLYP
jgi:hypothetical protein